MLDNLSFRQKITTLVLFAVFGIAVIATHQALGLEEGAGIVRLALGTAA